MAMSWRSTKDLVRDLSSVCPDGVEIKTPWDPAWTWDESQRLAQAIMHRDAVRVHLDCMRTWERAA
jgi:metal-sulfur cluster biosynthetic enzyme